MTTGYTSFPGLGRTGWAGWIKMTQGQENLGTEAEGNSAGWLFWIQKRNADKKKRQSKKELSFSRFISGEGVAPVPLVEWGTGIGGTWEMVLW